MKTSKRKGYLYAYPLLLIGYTVYQNWRIQFYWKTKLRKKVHEVFPFWWVLYVLLPSTLLKLLVRPDYCKLSPLLTQKQEELRLSLKHQNTYVAVL